MNSENNGRSATTWHTVMYLIHCLCKQDANDIAFVEAPNGDLILVNMVELVPSWCDKKGRLRQCTLKQAKRRDGRMTLVIRGEK